jgi:ferredoxin
MVAARTGNVMIHRFLNKLGRGPAIETRAHLCLRTRFARARCRRCQEVCPAGAVSLDGDAVALRESCSGCEACIAACPAGVFAAPVSREVSRRSRLRELVEADPKLLVTCAERAPAGSESALVLPCLGGLAKEYLIAAFAWGARHIEIQAGHCEACAQAAALSQYERSVHEARRLLACFDRPADGIEEVSSAESRMGEGSSSELPPAERLGRREFFSYFRKRAAQAAAEAPVEASTEEQEARWTHEEHPLRAFLLEVLPALGSPGQAHLPAAGFPVADLIVSPACIGCNVCETLCPTGAIRREVQSESALSLMFTPGRCTGCGICAQACLPKAIGFSEAVDVNELVSGAEKLLIDIKGKPCRICSRPFLGLPGDLCPRCLGKGRGQVPRR